MKEESQKELEKFMFEQHGQFVNEDDFEGGQDSYMQFLDQYIDALYGPRVLEYDEAKYFSEDGDLEAYKEIKWKRGKRLVSIEPVLK